jgi:decaprenylphospho-beta-D-erythro-pentofuranosid-2-ulose 2-reductase
MQNAFGEPQMVVVLGGTSEIGRAIVASLEGPALRTVVLGCRDVAAGHQAARAMGTAVTIDVVEFHAERPETHRAWFDEIVARHGDPDVVVMAVGALADTEQLGDDPVAVANTVTATMTGPAAAMVAAASLLRRQGHGHLVVLSSVAGERVRASLAVYGGAKAGLDAVAQGLADQLHGSGAHVLIVRPGFVRTRMTAHLPDGPFATTAEAVAAATVQGLARRRRIVWVPGVLRYVFMVLRHVPTPVWRRIAARA